MLLTLNNINLNSCHLEIPYDGQAVANLAGSGADLLDKFISTDGVNVGPTFTSGTDAILTIDEVSLVGKIWSIYTTDQIHMVWRAGKGDMSLNPAAARELSNCKGSVIISNLLQGTGFNNPVAIPADVSEARFAHFQIVKGVPVGIQLNRFLSLFVGQEYVWRVEPAGNIQIVKKSAEGRLTILPTDSNNVIAPVITSDHSFSIIIPELLGYPEPGGLMQTEFFTLSATQIPNHINNFISDVTIDVGADELKLTYFYNQNIISLNDYKDVLQQDFIATVVSHNVSENTVEVLPDNLQIRGGGIKNVPIILSAAQKVISVPKNTKCIIGFNSSDPTKMWCKGFFLDNQDVAINIFGNPDQAQQLAKYDDLKAELDHLQGVVDDLVNAHNTHIHITTATVGATSTPGTIAPTTTQAQPNGPINAFNTTKLKAE